MCPDQKDLVFDSYPFRIVAIATFLSLSIYLMGTVLVWQFTWWSAVLYMSFCLTLELKLLKRSCVNCYYYGKTCFSGKGRIAALLFKRGDVAGFAKKEVGWIEIVPDLMVVLIPLCVGCYILIQSFQWNLVIAIILLLLLAFPGNGYIRSNLACRHCCQRRVGCPAEKLFHKKSNPA